MKTTPKAQTDQNTAMIEPPIMGNRMYYEAALAARIASKSDERKKEAETWTQARRAVPFPSQLEKVRDAAAKQLDALRHALFSSVPVPGYQEEALVNLFKLVAEACCYRFAEFCTPELLAVILERGCKEHVLSFEQMRQLKHMTKNVQSVLALERKRLTMTMPVRPNAKATNIVIYQLVRLRVGKILMMRHDIEMGNVLAGEPLLEANRQAIKILPYYGNNHERWAKLINKMIWSDPHEKNRLAPTGDIYEAIKKPAMAGRQNKRRRAFQSRYDKSPEYFLKLTTEKKMEIKDGSKRTMGEPLNVSQVKAATVRAREIEGMHPTPAELKSCLCAKMLECMNKNIP